MQLSPELEPGHRLAAAPLVAPPDSQLLHQPQPPAALSFVVRRVQHRDAEEVLERLRAELGRLIDGLPLELRRPASKLG
jgi:hypothetical protein